MSIVHTKTERKFNPHLLLLRGAQHHLRTAKEKEGGWYYNWLGAILLSALSIEAIGNSYGALLIGDWKDFESASPIAKLRLVATRCGVKPDFGKQPWQTARLLIIFRNRIAHPKPEHLKLEKDCTLSDYGQIRYAKLESNLEKMVTEEFAIKSCDAVQQILTILNKTLKDAELHALTTDGQEYGAQVA